MLLWDLVVMLNDNALGTSLHTLHSAETKAFKMSITISNHLSIIFLFYFYTSTLDLLTTLLLAIH